MLCAFLAASFGEWGFFESSPFHCHLPPVKVKRETLWDDQFSVSSCSFWRHPAFFGIILRFSESSRCFWIHSPIFEVSLWLLESSCGFWGPSCGVWSHPAVFGVILRFLRVILQFSESSSSFWGHPDDDKSPFCQNTPNGLVGASGDAIVLIAVTVLVVLAAVVLLVMEWCF